MELDKTVEELLQKPKDSHDKGALDVIHARRKQLADVFFDKSRSVKDRNAVYNELLSIHKYLGLSTELFKVKEPKIPGAKPQRTPEQKKEDSVKMIRDLWPEAKKYALEQVPKDETAMPTKDGPIVVDKNAKERSILAQVFLYNMVELYKQ